MTSIIQRDLERAVAVASPTARYARLRDDDRSRRGTYIKGQIRKKNTAVSLPLELHGELTAFSAQMKINRSVIIARALEMYLGMARQEGLIKPVPTIVRQHATGEKKRPVPGRNRPQVVPVEGTGGNIHVDEST